MSRVQTDSAIGTPPDKEDELDSSGTMVRIPPFIGRVVGDAYRITEFQELRSGYPLFDAEHQRLKRHADIWVIDDFFRFEDAQKVELAQRASVYARISHPNLARLIDFHLATDEVGTFIFEPAAGMNLQEYFEVYGPLPFPLWSELALQLLSATAALHAGDYFLGSLNSRQMGVRTIEGKLFVQLLDPGLSSGLQSTKAKHPHSKQAFHFTSPWSDGNELRRQGDLFVLAHTLIFLLTGGAQLPSDSALHDVDGKVLNRVRAVFERALNLDTISSYSLSQFTSDLKAACELTHESVPGLGTHQPETVAMKRAASHKKTPLEHTSYRVSSRPPRKNERNIEHHEILERLSLRTPAPNSSPSSEVRPSTFSRQNVPTRKEGLRALDKSKTAPEPSIKARQPWLESLERELASVYNELRFATLELEVGGNSKRGYGLLKSAIEQAHRMRAVFDIWSPTEASMGLPESARNFKVSLERVEQEVSRMALAFIARELGDLDTIVKTTWDQTQNMDLSFLSAEEIFLLARAKQSKSLSSLIQTSSRSRVLGLLSIMQLCLYGCLAKV